MQYLQKRRRQALKIYVIQRIAYIRIKVLVENKSTDFNSRELLGKLIREYNSHIAKVGM